MHECSIEREAMKNAGIKRIDTYRDLLNELNITIINDRETIKLLREQNEKLKEQLSSAQPTHPNDSNTLKTLDCIGRQEAVEAMYALVDGCVCDDEYRENPHIDAIVDTLENLQPAQLERDVPVKPIETTDRAWGIPHKQAVCPKCEYYLGHIAFLGDYNGKRITYCETCGQAIDWEGWDFDE